MSRFAEQSSPNADAGGDQQFLVRWRGKQEGPYSASVIERKLALNQIGLLHEILHEGRWVTIRDYLSERERTRQAERQLKDDQERRQREEAEQKAREREEELRVATLAEERRRNDLLEAQIEQRNQDKSDPRAAQTGLKTHRGGSILAVALIGLLLCGPLCVVAWAMGSNDLQAMDSGTMDVSGRSTTESGRNIGILGTILWSIGVAFFFFGGGRGML